MFGLHNRSEDRIWLKNTSFHVGGKPLRFTPHPASLAHEQRAGTGTSRLTLIAKRMHFASTDVSLTIKIPHSSMLAKALTARCAISQSTFLEARMLLASPSQDHCAL